MHDTRSKTAVERGVRVVRERGPSGEMSESPAIDMSEKIEEAWCCWSSELARSGNVEGKVGHTND